MSLAKIAPDSHTAIRLHGWVLMLWCTSVGFFTSYVMLHLFQVHSMAIRYGVGAGAVYFAGFILGGWGYARWLLSKAGLSTPLPKHASVEEQVAYTQAVERRGKRLGSLEGFSDFASIGDDPISLLLSAFALLVFLVAVIYLLGWTPILLTDALAGYLAEIALEFVIGALVVRRILKPKPMHEYWQSVLGRTWVAGLLLTISAIVFGYLIQQFNPTAASLIQVFR